MATKYNCPQGALHGAPHPGRYIDIRVLHVFIMQNPRGAFSWFAQRLLVGCFRPSAFPRWQTKVSMEFSLAQLKAALGSEMKPLCIHQSSEPWSVAGHGKWGTCMRSHEININGLLWNLVTQVQKGRWPRAGSATNAGLRTHTWSWTALLPEWQNRCHIWEWKWFGYANVAGSIRPESPQPLAPLPGLLNFGAVRVRCRVTASVHSQPSLTMFICCFELKQKSMHWTPQAHPQI